MKTKPTYRQAKMHWRWLLINDALQEIALSLQYLKNPPKIIV